MIRKSLSDRILKLASGARRKIGISILKTSPEIIASLRKSRKIADVVIYGKKISGFENAAGKGQETGMKMVRDFKAGKIDEFVRGQVDDFALVDEAKRLFGIDPKLRRIQMGLMQDAYGRQFFLVGASNTDLQTLDEKIRISTEASKWIKSVFRVQPKVAIMATCRPGSYGKDPVMSATYDEAEAVVTHLKYLGYSAKNVHIEIEHAVEFADLIVPARGTIGNQIFRAVLYLGKGKNIASPTIFPGKLIYEDNSRNEKDWYPHVVFAAALANMK